MKLLKRNQVIIYVIAIMIMTAGYLNYTTNTGAESVETSLNIETKDDSKLADLGDATLVSSNDIVNENEKNTKQQKENGDKPEEIKKEENKENKNKEKKEDTKETNSAIDKNNTEDYFIKSKLERDTMYSQMLETYEKILNSSNSLETQKQTATQEITKINETKNGIMIAENLLRTKGFEKNLIFVNKESVSVIIGKTEIKKDETAQIQNIVSRELHSKVENINISNK